MEFVCEDVNALVRAANVRATLDAFGLVPSMGERLIARHRLDIRELTPDKFVPVQHWLNALKEIQDEVGTAVLRRVGANIIENAEFPPHFKTVESILEALDEIYHVNHRGEVGHYQCVRRAGAIMIHCETPYPRFFELGLIEGICRNRKATRKYVILFEEGPPLSKRTCTVTVRSH